MRKLALLLALAGLAACPEPEGDPADAGRLDARPFLPDCGCGAPDAGEPGPADAAVPLGPCSAVKADQAAAAAYDSVLACVRNPAEQPSAKQAAVATFVTAVESHGGFPIAIGDDFVFAYVRDPAFDAEDDRENDAEDYAAARRAGPIRVAGDFNAWQPALTLAAENADLFHARASLPGAAGKRWGYKFVARDGAGQDVWFSDPLSRRFAYDDNGRISFVRGGDTKGHLEWIRSVHATKLGNDRPVYLYVPRGYDTATRSYPVLYMHDGNNLFDVSVPRAAFAAWGADAVAEAEIGAGRAREFLIVGPANTDDRMNEYTHTADTVGGDVYPGKGAAYADFLVFDLKPLVDARYRTLTGFADTGLLGSSLGGLISYYVALEYPQVFKYVGGMSSTFGWGSTPGQTVLDLYAATSGLGTRGHVYYLDSGGQPPPNGAACTYTLADDSGDSDNYCVTLKMKDLLVAAGYDTFPDDPTASRLTPDGIEVLHYWQPGAPHNEVSWNARLPMAFRLFFRP